jgi:hypothetical protein
MVVTSPTPIPSLPKLDWELNHPERAAWTASLLSIIAPFIDVFSSAKDITQFRSDYATLTTAQKISIVAEIFCWDAYYESSWDPTQYSVDVGNSNNKNTWSVGLLQMSVTDQANYGFKFGYSFTDLQSPTPNLTLAVNVMVKQIQKYGVIMIPQGSPGDYWSTLHPGGKYDASASIIKAVKAFKP